VFAAKDRALMDRSHQGPTDERDAGLSQDNFQDNQVSKGEAGAEALRESIYHKSLLCSVAFWIAVSHDCGLRRSSIQHHRTTKLCADTHTNTWG
jgi:hypothetical protein